MGVKGFVLRLCSISAVYRLHVCIVDSDIKVCIAVDFFVIKVLLSKVRPVSFTSLAHM